jgi:hypothetical protein
MNKSIILCTLVCLIVLLPAALLGGCKQEQELATIKYRDRLEMGTGECEGIIFRLSKGDSWLENREVAYTLGILGDGDLKPLPESFEVLENWNFGRGDEAMAIFQETLVRVKTSPNISPGEYDLSVQLEVEGKGVIDYLTLTINVTEAADDIVETPGGPAYRAQVHGPDIEEWPLVEEQTVALGTQGVQLEYRDFVEMGIGACKGVLFTLRTAGTELENKDINYTVGLLEEDTFKPLPEEPLEVVETWTYGSPPHQLSPVTVILIGTDYRMNRAEEFNLGVQLEAEGTGVIGLVPLTISVVEAADDILFPPGGVAYRANVHGPGEEPWPPVEEKRVVLEAP